MKNRGFNILFVLVCLAYVADFVSTIINGEYVKYLEANILYQRGGWALFWLINVIILALTYYVYWKAKSVGLRYTMTYLLCFVLITKIVLVINNVNVYLHPPPMELAVQVTQADRVAYATNYVLLPNIFPYFVAWLTYAFYKYDHDIKQKT